MVTGRFDHKRARRLRKLAGLTLGDASAKMDISQTNLRYWEQGKFEPDDEQIEQLSKVLHCEPEALVRWK